MATPSSPYAIPSTIDTFVLNTTVADYRGRLTDNAYNKNIILRIARDFGSVEHIDGGTSIVENLIESQQDNGGFYLGADTLENNQTNTLTMVEYKWQNAYEPIVLTRDEERANSGDEHKILKLVGTKAMLSEKAIAKRLEQALSTPVAAANNLESLEDVIDSAGKSGSIDGDTDTFWAATETTSGSFATQGLSDMATAYYAVSSSADEDNPTHIITTKTVFKKYRDTRLPLERISNGDLSANVGVKNLTFSGIPVTYGNYIGSGLMFGINMNYLKIYMDSATDFITTDFVVPSNQTVRIAYVLARLALGTNNRRRHFKLSSIS